MIGSESVLVNTASDGAIVVSIVGSLASSIKPASVTEAQAKDNEAIVSRAKRELNVFIMVFSFVYIIVVNNKSVQQHNCYKFYLFLQFKFLT